MYQRRLIRLLLSPSPSSLVFCVVLTSLIVLGAAWPTMTNNKLLAEQLYGQYGVVTVLQQMPSVIQFIAAFSLNPIIYDVLLVIAAVVSACIVYATLQVISHIITDSYDAYQELHGPPVSDGHFDSAHTNDTVVRLGVRLTSLVLWVVYLYFFVSVFVPACALAVSQAAGNFFGWGAIEIPGIFLILLAMCHVQIICLRFLALRPRIFGGKLAITLALYDASGIRQKE